MSREGLIAVMVWKFLIDCHLKLSLVREATLKYIFKSSILIKVSNWDMRRALDQLK